VAVPPRADQGDACAQGAGKKKAEEKPAQKTD
jgi:hypothetical protein